jgi:hypothetical protein
MAQWSAGFIREYQIKLARRASELPFLELVHEEFRQIDAPSRIAAVAADLPKSQAASRPDGALTAL